LRSREAFVCHNERLVYAVSATSGGKILDSAGSSQDSRRKIPNAGEVCGHNKP
jgi:hypothetical protein